MIVPSQTRNKKYSIHEIVVHLLMKLHYQDEDENIIANIVIWKTDSMQLDFRDNVSIMVNEHENFLFIEILLLFYCFGDFIQLLS